jgi:hypothetical protein
MELVSSALAAIVILTGGFWIFHWPRGRFNFIFGLAGALVAVVSVALGWSSSSTLGGLSHDILGWSPPSDCGSPPECWGYAVLRWLAGLSHEGLGKLLIGFWLIAPPVFFWVDWVRFCRNMQPDDRKITEHTHDLARNIWIGLVAILAVLFAVRLPT